MTGKWILTAAVCLMLSEVSAVQPVQPVKKTEPGTAEKRISPEEMQKIQELKNLRLEILKNIRKKRAELLSGNPKLRKMYLQLLQLSRELALELDSNREMKELNDAYYEIEKKLNQKLEKHNIRKPEGR